MTQKDSTHAGAPADDAARWFVRVDAGEPVTDAALASWLAERPENERALERVELAAVLGKRLAADRNGALYAEAALAARAAPRRRAAARALALGGALAAALLVAVLVMPMGAPPPATPELVSLRAADTVTFAAPVIPVAVLPSGAVVDASAVAVLPFGASGDAMLAQRLERAVAASLRTVPGLYVIADDAVQPYAATELDPAEIGAQLGARGLVDAAVELVDGRVYVRARLRESATGATLWQAAVDRPADELSAIRYEIAENVAATMLDGRLRELAARSSSSNASVSASKPFQQ